MPANTSPIFEITVWRKGCQLVNATGTTKTLVAAAGSNGSRYDMVSCSTTDTSAETLSFWAYDGSSIYYHLGDVSLPVGAGYTNVPLVDAVPILAPSLGYIALQSGYSLYVSAGTAVTSSKQTDVLAQGGDY